MTAPVTRAAQATEIAYQLVRRWQDTPRDVPGAFSRLGALTPYETLLADAIRDALLAFAERPALPRATTMGVSGYVVVEKTQASPPASERDADPPVRRVIVNICEPCIRAEGQECHTPGCLLFLHRVDIPFMEELMEPAPESAGLFRSGPVTLHSGAVSDFKIDCDALTNEDWRALATMVAAGAGAVGKVSGIPRGGLKLADALTGVVTWVATGPVLIVDDVLTTGTSMEQARRAQIEAGETREIKGAVVFARIPSAPWISALFTMSPEPAAFRAGRG